MAATFGDRLPVRHAARGAPPVVRARWPRTCRPGASLLPYPAAFSGNQSAMAWQAVNVMHYSQAGGGGPQGVVHRAGGAAPGFVALADLGGPFGQPSSTGSPAQMAAVRHALAVWQVTTVVITPRPRGARRRAGERPRVHRRLHDGRLGHRPDPSGRGLGMGRCRCAPSVARPTAAGPGALVACVPGSGPAAAQGLPRWRSPTACSGPLCRGGDLVPKGQLKPGRCRADARESAPTRRVWSA